MPRKCRILAVFAASLVLVAASASELWATTTAPPPFEFINGIILYIRATAIPTIILALMFGGIAWLFTKNGEGIVQWGGRALMVLALIMGGGTFLAVIGFQGAVI
jgi:hypothetical protein